MKSLIIALFFTIIAFTIFTPSSLAQYKKPVRPNTIAQCTTASALNTNPNFTPEERIAITPYLNRLNSYQSNCYSKAFGSMMIFTSMPQAQDAIIEESTRVSNLLKAMSKIGIKPIVVAEPISQGTLLNFIQFSNGAYDTSIQSFFTNLKSMYVTDSMMGMWVPFPEPNIPTWDSIGSSPTMIANNFNKYMQNLRLSFPTVKGSLLLNSRTYAPEDKNYTNGVYTSFAEYGSNLNAQYLDSVGIQGFPWYSPKNQQWGNTKTADVFLQPSLTIEFARSAKTKRVWFNTGSASSVYTNDSLKTVTIPSQDRASVLNSILSAANQVKLTLGYNSNVMLNIFAQDKSTTPEAINWSYTTLSDLAVFKTFITNAYLSRLDLGYFDITS